LATPRHHRHPLRDLTRRPPPKHGIIRYRGIAHHSQPCSRRSPQIRRPCRSACREAIFARGVSPQIRRPCRSACREAIFTRGVSRVGDTLPPQHLPRLYRSVCWTLFPPLPPPSARILTRRARSSSHHTPRSSSHRTTRKSTHRPRGTRRPRREIVVGTRVGGSHRVAANASGGGSSWTPLRDTVERRI
jgi:hypothetical protein